MEKFLANSAKLFLKVLLITGLLALFIPLVKSVIKHETPNLFQIIAAAVGLYAFVIVLGRRVAHEHVDIIIRADELEVKSKFRNETFHKDEIRAWSYREGKHPALVIHPKIYKKKLILVDFDHPDFENIERWAKANFPNRDEIDAKTEWKEVKTQLGIEPPDKRDL